MSKASTVKEIRRQQFKIDIARVKRFLTLTDSEFDSIFIDGEPDGHLHGRMLLNGWDIFIIIYRNGRAPEFFCLDNREVEKELNRTYQDLFPGRSQE